MKPTVGPSQIQRYNSMMHQACQCEQKKEWHHAAKLWFECQIIAAANHWKAKRIWCGNRANFCEHAMARGW